MIDNLPKECLQKIFGFIPKGGSKVNDKNNNDRHNLLLVNKKFNEVINTLSDETKTQLKKWTIPEKSNTRWTIGKDGTLTITPRCKWNPFNRGSSLSLVFNEMTSKLNAISEPDTFSNSTRTSLTNFKNMVQVKKDSYYTKHWRLYIIIIEFFTGRKLTDSYTTLITAIDKKITVLNNLETPEHKTCAINLENLKESYKTLCRCSETRMGHLWINKETGAIQQIWGHDAEPLSFDGEKHTIDNTGTIEIGIEDKKNVNWPSEDYFKLNRKNFRIIITNEFQKELSSSALKVLELMSKKFKNNDLKSEGFDYKAFKNIQGPSYQKKGGVYYKKPIDKNAQTINLIELDSNKLYGNELTSYTQHD
jgi:hypothetical protein